MLRKQKLLYNINAVNAREFYRGCRINLRNLSNADVLKKIETKKDPCG